MLARRSFPSKRLRNIRRPRNATLDTSALLTLSCQRRTPSQWRKVLCHHTLSKLFNHSCRHPKSWL